MRARRIDLFASIYPFNSKHLFPYKILILSPTGIYFQPYSLI